MHYVISDIHGDYKQYMNLLKKIRFTSHDVLYVLGDVLDRGKDGFRILRDMSCRDNVIPILGNHEYMAVQVIPWLFEEVSDESIREFADEKLQAVTQWISVGGDSTIRELKAMDRDEVFDLVDYMMDFSLLEEVVVNGKRFILVHGGLKSYDPEKALEDYTPADVLFSSPDYEVLFDEEDYLVTGHLPTFEIRQRLHLDPSDDVLILNHHIAVDGGCGFKRKLCAFCLETMQSVQAD